MPYYETTYKDKFGQENTFINSDGSSLQIAIRGVHFNGQCLNDFEPIGIALDKAKEVFHLDQYHYLTDCELTVIFPIRLNTPNGFSEVPLTICIKLEDGV
jgi:hypothetical protein